MGFLDKLGSFLKREAKDIGAAADGAKDKFDQELTKREVELAMTPSEKIAALQEKASLGDDKLDRIADKALGREAMAEAVAEVGEISDDTDLPNVTHIVLPEEADASSAEDEDAQEEDAHQERAEDDAASSTDSPSDDGAPGSNTAAPDKNAPAASSDTPSGAVAAADAAEAAAASVSSGGGTDYAKTPAQIKYEQARAAADDLLKELRGELKDDGEI